MRKKRSKTVEALKEITLYTVLVLYILVAVTIVFGILKLLQERRLYIPCFNIWDLLMGYILASIMAAVLIYLILEIKRRK